MKIKFKPDIYFASSIAFILLFHSLFPIAKIVSYPYSLLGLIVILIALLTIFATNLLLLKNNTSIQPFDDPTQLITSGPFKYTRNPIYLSMAISLFGVVITCGSLSPLIFPFLFIGIINNKFIPKEEQTLEKLFGAEYLLYKAKVKRWI